MSFSNPTSEKLVNPAKKFIKFSGETGEFSYYDKDAGQNVLVPLPITFTVLDECCTITGYSEVEKSNIFSNEVKDSRFGELNVRTHGSKDAKGNKTKGVEIAKGLYQAIKPEIVAVGGKYTASVYALMDGEIVNFHFRGASLSPWIEKGINTTKFSISVVGYTEGKKGKVTYRMPEFKACPVADHAGAVAADTELQAYFASYMAPDLTTRTTEDTRDAPAPDAPTEELGEWDNI